MKSIEEIAAWATRNRKNEMSDLAFRECIDSSLNELIEDENHTEKISEVYAWASRNRKNYISDLAYYNTIIEQLNGLQPKFEICQPNKCKFIDLPDGQSVCTFCGGIVPF